MLFEEISVHVSEVGTIYVKDTDVDELLVSQLKVHNTHVVKHYNDGYTVLRTYDSIISKRGVTIYYRDNKTRCDQVNFLVQVNDAIYYKNSVAKSILNGDADIAADIYCFVKILHSVTVLDVNKMFSQICDMIFSFTLIPVTVRIPVQYISPANAIARVGPIRFLALRLGIQVGYQYSNNRCAVTAIVLKYTTTSRDL